MRFAVIAIGDDNETPYLEYVVADENEAESLAASGDDGDAEIWAIKTPRGVMPCVNGIPRESDGTPENAIELAAALAPYIVSKLRIPCG